MSTPVSPTSVIKPSNQSSDSAAKPPTQAKASWRQTIADWLTRSAGDDTRGAKTQLIDWWRGVRYGSESAQNTRLHELAGALECGDVATVKEALASVERLFPPSYGQPSPLAARLAQLPAFTKIPSKQLASMCDSLAKINVPAPGGLRETLEVVKQHTKKTVDLKLQALKKNLEDQSSAAESAEANAMNQIGAGNFEEAFASICSAFERSENATQTLNKAKALAPKLEDQIHQPNFSERYFAERVDYALRRNLDAALGSKEWTSFFNGKERVIAGIPMDSTHKQYFELKAFQYFELIRSGLGSACSVVNYTEQNHRAEIDSPKTTSVSEAATVTMENLQSKWNAQTANVFSALGATQPNLGLALHALDQADLVSAQHAQLLNEAPPLGTSPPVSPRFDNAILISSAAKNSGLNLMKSSLALATLKSEELTDFVEQLDALQPVVASALKDRFANLRTNLNHLMTTVRSWPSAGDEQAGPHIKALTLGGLGLKPAIVGIPLGQLVEALSQSGHAKAHASSEKAAREIWAIVDSARVVMGTKPAELLQAAGQQLFRDLRSKEPYQNLLGKLYPGSDAHRAITALVERS